MAYIQGHARDQMLLLTALTGHGIDGPTDMLSDARPTHRTGAR